MREKSQASLWRSLCRAGSRVPGSSAQPSAASAPAALSPVLHGVEGLLVGDVVHEDEAHGPPVVGRGDGAVPLLAGRVLRKRRRGSEQAPDKGGRDRRTG